MHCAYLSLCFVRQCVQSAASNDGVLYDRARQLRESKATAVSVELENHLGRAPNRVEVELVVETSPGRQPRLAAGPEVANGATQPRHIGTAA
jgi:hypothetical protein